MIESIYDRQNYDVKISKGDTLDLVFSLYSEDDSVIDVTGEGDADLVWDAYFNIRDPLTFAILPDLEKIREEGGTENTGIYYYGDTMPSNLTVGAVNEIAVRLLAADTEDMAPGSYPYYLKFVIPAVSAGEEITVIAVKGNIIVTTGDE